jgi:hypothetical protein
MRDLMPGLMILGFKFSNELDLTAIGTLLLAASTLLSLFFVRRSLNQTQLQINLGQRQLAQTQHEIGFSRKEICLSRKDAEAAHRPVVVPVAGGQHFTLANGEDLPAGPYLPKPGLLVVPIMNVGLGPALCLDWAIEGPALADSWSERQRLGEVTGIGVSEVISLEIAIDDLNDVPDFNLTLTYDGVAGKGWRTVAGWIADGGRYEGLAIASCRRDGRDSSPKARQPFRRGAARERELADLGVSVEADAVRAPS